MSMSLEILWRKNIVGHVHQNMLHFLKNFNVSAEFVCVQVLGSRVNRGTGYDLEVPGGFIFQGYAKCVT